MRLRATRIGADNASDGHPARLFESGNRGFCLPSVASAFAAGALSEDAEGTTPAAMGLRVGRVAYPAGSSSVVSQPTATKRPILHARYNVHADTEDFLAASWTRSGATVDVAKFLGPSGALNAQKVTFAPGNVGAVLFQNIPAFVGTLTRRFAVRADTPTNIRARFRNNGGSTAAPVINVGTSWAVVTGDITGTGTGLDQLGFQNNAAGASAPIYIAELDVRPGGGIPQSLPPYQRVVSATDYDAVGFTPFLRFDGLDDCLSAANIDFTSTDAATVLAAIRKNTTTATGAVCEHGTAGVAGAFGVFAPVGSQSAGHHVYIQSRGTADGGWYHDISSAGFAVFASVVVPAGLARAEKFPAYAVNGNPAYARYAGGAADPQAAAVFQNGALHIGQRNAGSFAYNGDLYSLIVINRRLSEAEIVRTSHWINRAMGRVY